jgi:NAD(P)-dependent dehydrogenase (short-subunit alcohol dehydrogenase family)
MTFGATSTTDDVLDGVDLSGKRAVVTGASTGLGEETTRALSAHGAAITMAVRDTARGDAAAARIRELVPEADLEVRQLELGSLASVRAFAEGFLAEHNQLDLLINNAGVMASPYGTTEDGFELQFGTNHLGHFLLANLLAPVLVAAAPSRVISLSSAGHRFSDIDLDDPGFETTEYEPWVSYGRAKTANALFAVGFDARYGGQGVHAYSLHPASSPSSAATSPRSRSTP